MMARLFRAMARLDAHWSGDLIGVVCLFSFLSWACLSATDWV